MFIVCLFLLWPNHFQQSLELPSIQRLSLTVQRIPSLNKINNISRPNTEVPSLVQGGFTEPTVLYLKGKTTKQKKILYKDEHSSGPPSRGELAPAQGLQGPAGHRDRTVPGHDGHGV